jgi:hypothetical protein
LLSEPVNDNGGTVGDFLDEIAPGDTGMTNQANSVGR